MGPISLTAVNPNWTGARNGVVERRERCRIIWYRVEARIKASDTVRIQGAAWRSKRGLSCCVVFLMEFKCDDVTWCGADVRGSVNKSGRPSNDNGVDLTTSRRCAGSCTSRRGTSRTSASIGGGTISGSIIALRQRGILEVCE